MPQTRSAAGGSFAEVSRLAGTSEHLLGDCTKVRQEKSTCKLSTVKNYLYRIVIADKILRFRVGRIIA